MQRDELYLADIVEAADAITRFLGDAKEQVFAGNDLLRSAVLQKLIVIGEAAGRVSGDLRKQYAEIPWIDIIAFRNIAVHAYFSVNWPIVWTTATEEVPALRAQVVQIIEDINPGDEQ
ncbi:MAG: DUF86 domain-containing protein [Planctomycetes bacterium]|nr:DUF86 domain-containing protein [Planctomycetota bacterium]